MSSKTWFVIAIVVVAMSNLMACSTSVNQAESSEFAERANPLLYAVAWKRTAAEYRALYYQGFNLAQHKVQTALENFDPADKPLAIISDLDDTLFHTGDYWAGLIAQNRDFFDDAVWDEWVQSEATSASPGALEFLTFCAANNVEIFYVTNRDQGDITFANTLAQLRQLDFPYADEEHLFVLQASSNKQLVQDRIGQEHNVIALLGDNLNDFSRKYYSTDVNERQLLLELDSTDYGNRYIIFPNPTDGHWIRAIFGESEPAPTDTNRETLRRAASSK